MNRAAAVLFAFLFGSAALAAQTATADQAQLQTLTQMTAAAPSPATGPTAPAGSPAQPQSRLAVAMEQIAQLLNGCPVTLRAQHAPGGDSMMVNGIHVKGPAQALHLIVTNRDSRQVVAANLTVWGFSGNPRLAQTLTTHNASEAARTLDVRFAGAPGKETSADFAVPGLTASTAIVLNSVTYADGSTWKLAPGGSCWASVDGVMRIGDR